MAFVNDEQADVVVADPQEVLISADSTSEVQETVVIPESEQIKSKKRVADHGEVFTNEREVNAMLDLVKQETERIDSRFLEPACGTGNFLVEILRRKLVVVKFRYGKSQLEYERYAILAISSIYGIDLLIDNVIECRNRLLELFKDSYTDLFHSDTKAECIHSAQFILSKNIIQGDALTLNQVDSDQPIVFSEWNAVNGSKIKRRDFTFANLLEAEAAKTPNTLFSDQYESDPAFLPKAIAEYPLTHFLNLMEQDD